MEELDLFISYSNADMENYISPLTDALAKQGISFWLASVEIEWGNKIAMSINDAFRTSKYVLLCLSSNFLGRPWPENEMNAAISIQNETGVKRIFPLILNSKDEVLKRYPIIAGLSYREFSAGVEALTSELTALLKKPDVSTKDLIRIYVESLHTGRTINLNISPKVSVESLIQKARIAFGLKEALDTGGYSPFLIRWILVDTKAEKDWEILPRSRKRKIRAIIKTEKEPMFSYTHRHDRLEDVGICDGMVFHLYHIENVDDDELLSERFSKLFFSGDALDNLTYKRILPAKATLAIDLIGDEKLVFGSILPKEMEELSAHLRIKQSSKDVLALSDSSKKDDLLTPKPSDFINRKR